LIGAFSDKCTSKLGKRRPFIIVSGVLTCLSMVGVAYAKEIGHFAATLFHDEPDVIKQTVSIMYIVTQHKKKILTCHRLIPMRLLLL
jgi:solute carrier family 45 protein 1/2/4